MDDLWASKSEDVRLIVRTVSFQDFQVTWSWSTNVTDGQTTCDRKTALCTVVHRAVKSSLTRNHRPGGGPVKPPESGWKTRASENLRCWAAVGISIRSDACPRTLRNAASYSAHNITHLWRPSMSMPHTTFRHNTNPTHTLAWRSHLTKRYRAPSIRGIIIQLS